jgi:hypothetical protein
VSAGALLLKGSDALFVVVEHLGECFADAVYLGFHLVQAGVDFGAVGFEFGAEYFLYVSDPIVDVADAGIVDEGSAENREYGDCDGDDLRVCHNFRSPNPRHRVRLECPAIPIGPRRRPHQLIQDKTTMRVAPTVDKVCHEDAPAVSARLLSAVTAGHLDAAKNEIHFKVRGYSIPVRLSKTKD